MGLRENILTDPVSELAYRPLLTIDPSTPIREALPVMRDAKIGCVVIVDDAGRPQAMFTEKNLVALLGTGTGSLDDSVEKHMTHEFCCVTDQDTVVQVIGMMQSRRQRWIIVVDDAGKAKAITGLRGAIEYVVDHFPRQVKVEPIGTKLSMDQREGA